MFMQLLGEILAVVVASALWLGGMFLWSILRRMPWVMSAIGMALLMVAAALVQAITGGGANFRTEGSPAGTILFALFFSWALAAGVCGIFFLGRGLWATFRGGARHVFLTVTAMLMVFFAGLQLMVSTPAGKRSRIEAEGAPPRKDPTFAETRIVRTVPLKEGYALAWAARDDSPALRLKIAPRLFDALASVPETKDGPRGLPVYVERPESLSMMRLHRDASQLDDDSYARLYGRERKDFEPRRIVVDETANAWRLRALHCPAGTQERFPQLAREKGLQCDEPRGFFAKSFPKAFGPTTARFDMHADKGGCRITWLYRGRPVETTAPGACFSPASLDALDAAGRQLTRLEHESLGDLRPSERLAVARESVERCVRSRDPKACAQARPLALAEQELQPEAAAQMLAAMDRKAAAR